MDSETLERKEDWRSLLIIMFQYSCLYIGVGIVLLVVGLMTEFSKGHSTLAQRVWTMSWLVFGALYGILINLARINRFDPSRKKLVDESMRISDESLKRITGLDVDWYNIILIFMVSAPTIGGFVAVAQMIQQYGVCSRMLDASV